MDRFESLPDDARRKLATSPEAVQKNKVLPADVAEAMLTADKPIWTPKAMNAELGSPASNGTVRDKMDHLVEVGLAKSEPANQGQIYWWKHDASDWPMPPDVTVDGNSGVTVRELLEPGYAKIGLASMLIPSIAALPVLVGILAISGAFSLPVSGENLLSYGLVAIYFSYAGIVGSAFAGIIDYVLPDSYEIDLSGLR